MIAASESPRLPLHRMRVYNPGKLTDEELRIAFVARRDVFDRILGDVVGESPKSRAQHHMIVGQRGMGKTMLLLRLATELREMPHSDNFMPLVFAEEQYAVDRLSKFWLNCLDSLADACERSSDTVAMHRIDEAVRRLERSAGPSNKLDQRAARSTLDVFLEQARLSDRRPILLVDNLQLVFDRIDKKEQHELRELLMRPGGPILVGASPLVPSTTQDYGAPFFDQFKTHYLRPLHVDEMQRVITSLADAAGRPDIRQHVTANPGRLKALFHLTGGNPRTTVLLFHLYAQDCTTSVFADLEQLLDLVTPLYKARFEELAPQMQVVFGAMAAHWDPITNRELADQTGLSTTSISAQLDRLRKLGMIDEVSLYGTSRSGYQIAERFFDIWFLMRHASRRQRRQVEFLTRFLESFYEPPDRERLAKTISQEQGLSPDRLMFALSLACTIDDRHLRVELERNLHLDALAQQSTETRRRLSDILDVSSIPAEAVAFSELRTMAHAYFGEVLAEDFLGDLSLFSNRQRTTRLIETTTEQRQDLQLVLAKDRQVMVEQYGEEAVSWLNDRLAKGQLADIDSLDDWERTIHAAPQSRNHVRLLVRMVPPAVTKSLPIEAIDRLRTALNAPAGYPVDWYEWATFSRTHLARYEEAEAAYRRAIEINPQYVAAWVRLGNLYHLKMNRYSDAEGAFRRAIEIDPESRDSWYELAFLLHERLGRHEEAQAAYRRVIELDPTCAWAWYELGHVLQYRLNLYEEAESAYRQAIALELKSVSPGLELGHLLHYRLARYDEAEAAYRRALEVDPTFVRIWQELGVLLHYHLGRYEEAEVACRRAIQINPQGANTWNDLGNLLGDYLGRFEEADEAFAEAIRLDPSSSEVAMQNRVFLQRDILDRIDEARELFARIRPTMLLDCNQLQLALFAAYDQNWDIVSGYLAAALDLVPMGLLWNNVGGWVRATAVLLRLGFGDQLLELLRTRGDDMRLRPWYEAIRAHVAGAREALQNVAVEVRTMAEWFFDQIEYRRKALPQKHRDPRT